MPRNAPRTTVCTGWCAPTIIYAIIATVSTVLSFIHPELHTHQQRGVVLLANVVNGLFWTGLLYVLCSWCYTSWAWVLILVPFFIAFIALFFVSAIALTALKKKKEHMATYEGSYGSKFAAVPGSTYPDQILDLQAQRPSPHAPTHAKSVCDYAARPSKFDVLTRQQMQSPGTYMIPPGGINIASQDANTFDGCHEGFPPSPDVHYAMPPVQSS